MKTFGNVDFIDLRSFSAPEILKSYLKTIAAIFLITTKITITNQDSIENL
jgi:hypothetical protein